MIARASIDVYTYNKGDYTSNAMSILDSILTGVMYSNGHREKVVIRTLRSQKQVENE